MRIKYLLIIPFLSLLLNSCDDVGETTGPVGVVPYTYNFIIQQSDWEQSDYKNHWFVRLDIPRITEDVIDYGVVLVYYKNSYNSWVLLPYSTTHRSGDSLIYSEEIWSSYFLWGVDIDYRYTHILNSTPPVEMIIKVVVLQEQFNDAYYIINEIDTYDGLKKYQAIQKPQESHINWQLK